MENLDHTEKIIVQARQWTFDGDCSLLQWMQKISQNLEQRATHTTQALVQLNVDVKRTHTALENATNSLTALQYTQFVESRCHEDDERIANVAQVPVDVFNANKTTQSTQEILKTFLDKNLDMLRNCHEKYALDFDEDSDEEDAANNCIYQPKNPYNDRSLPHIYGSKLWKENWHVGLCDGANDYSGDEISEVFSESSSTTPDDNVSYESTKASLSEWTSSTSLHNDKFATNIAIQNASSLHGSQPLFPEHTNARNLLQAAAKVVSAGSDTSSNTSHTATDIRARDYDLFAPLQNTPPTSISSATSVPQRKTATTNSNEHSQSSSLSSSSRNVPFNDKALENVLFNTTVQTQEQQNASDFVRVKSAVNQIKRKPVNLFDDDDFNSFMSEITEKTQKKVDPTPIPAVRQQPITSVETITKAVEKTAVPTVAKRRQVVDLFAEAIDESSDKSKNLTTKPIDIEKPKEDIKRRVKNLFDSPDNSPTEDNLFSGSTAKRLTEKKSDKNVNITATTITAKSLFDDDEDDDFLNVFGTRKINIPTTFGKTMLFDDINEESGDNNSDLFAKEEEEEEKKTRKARLFENSSQAQDDTGDKPNIDATTLYANKNTRLNINQDAYNKATAVAHTEERRNTSTEKTSDAENKRQNQDLITASAIIVEPSKNTNLFPTDLFDDADIFSKNDSNIEQNEKKTISDALLAKSTFVKESVKIAHSSLFCDDVHDEIDDLFSKPLKSSKKTETDEKDNNEEIKNEINSVANSAQKPVQPENSKETSSILDNDQSEAVPTKFLLSSLEQLDEEINEQIDDPCAENSNFETKHNFNEEISENLDLETTPNTEISEDKNSKDEVHLNVETATHTYGSIFLDEPPDDDDFFQTLSSNSSKFPLDSENDFYEPASPNLPAAQKEVNNKPDAMGVSDYGGLRLFNELPPDDDDNLSVDSAKTTGEIKRIHSIFYDDFSETLEAVNKPKEQTLPAQTSLFVDELPPDDSGGTCDMKAKFETIKQSQKVSFKEVDKEYTQSVEEIKSTFEAATVDITDKATVAQQTDKNEAFPRISKLQKPSININVQALLPSAGVKPNFKKHLEESAASMIISDDQNIKNDNILANVCKNRVRAPAKRRPSTRRGRQENYRKSLIAAEEYEDDENDKAENIRAADATENVSFVSSAENSVAVCEEPTLYSINTIIENKATRDINVVSYNSSQTKNKQTMSDLFVDKDEDDDFLFQPASYRATKISKTTPTSFLNTDYAVEDRRRHDDEPKTTLVQDKLSHNVEVKPNSKLFSDFDEDDDLFEQVNTLKKHVAAATFSIPPSKNIAENTESIKKFFAKSPFANDEQTDSEDDLFKSHKSLISAKPATQVSGSSSSGTQQREAKKVVALFGSESDSGDNDDFLANLKKPEKPNEVSKITKVKESKTLFSDLESDEDSDDLFGSTSKTKKVVHKVSTATTKAIKDPLTAAQQQPAISVIAKDTQTSVADNPLADLLNL